MNINCERQNHKQKKVKLLARKSINCEQQNYKQQKKPLAWMSINCGRWSKIEEGELAKHVAYDKSIENVLYKFIVY